MPQLPGTSGVISCVSATCLGSAVFNRATALTLSSNQLNGGQSDTLAMTLTNTTSRSVSLSTGACDPRPIIVDTHNHVVVGAEPCILILLRLQLAPGEQHRRLFVWRTDSLSPGVYYVRATFRSEEVKLATPSETVRLN